jgi:hypothetical protein
MDLLHGGRLCERHRRTLPDLQMKYNDYGNFKYDFEVEKPPLFFYYTQKSDKGLSLAVDSDPRTADWGEIFFELMAMPTDTLKLKMPFSVISSMNRVAQKSRRARGNRIYANPETVNEIVVTMPDHFADVYVEHMSNFEKNFIIACYHKVDIKLPRAHTDNAFLDAEKNNEIRKEQDRFNGKFVDGAAAVDGPFAVYEGKLYVNPNWKDYFYKATLTP